MPVHSHHCAERLKPEWIDQPRKELGTSISDDDRLDDCRSHLRDPARQPMRDTPAVQRKTGNSGTLHFAIVPPRTVIVQLRAPVWLATTTKPKASSRSKKFQSIARAISAFTITREDMT